MAHLVKKVWRHNSTLVRNIPPAVDAYSKKQMAGSVIRGETDVIAIDSVNDSKCFSAILEAFGL